MTGVSGNKGAARPLVKTKRQKEAEAKRAIGEQQAAAAETAQTEAAAHAERLAQIVNLKIAGVSFAQIGAQIGSSAAEVEKMLTDEATAYVRTQPALRAYVRNWVSGKMAAMIEADWPQAINPDHPEKLPHQDRVRSMLVDMAKLHGAQAPVQSEVKIEAAPEAIEAMVAALASEQGQGYDASIFDVEVVEDEVPDLAHRNTTERLAALETSAAEVERPQPEDDTGL